MADAYAQTKYSELITAFLGEYLNVPKRMMDPYGNIKDEFIPQCLQLLIKEEVFDPKELAELAFTEYGILIPESWMEVGKDG